MLFCDKVYISSEKYQVLYNDPISHMKVKYRSACFAQKEAESFCI